MSSNNGMLPDGGVRRGGLSQSMHNGNSLNRPNGYNQAPQPPLGASRSNRRPTFQGQHNSHRRPRTSRFHCSDIRLEQAPRKVGWRLFLSRRMRDQMISKLEINNNHQVNSPDQANNIIRKDNQQQKNTHNHSQPRTTAKTETMGSFYTLELDYRDELWNSLQLKMPKYKGCESWVMPFPTTSSISFGDLAVFGYTKTSNYLDSRFVRLVFRTRLYDQDQELGKELSLTPSNPSIDLDDPRFRVAMVDAWWKLISWMGKLMKGNHVNLLELLKGEVEQELRQKQARSAIMEELVVSDMVGQIDQWVTENQA
ncbi:hypothetical protein PG994_002276 [Apiospora phragmitis]|uniref:Uncharacterized protein n=1 Tax=Apiospora phragmitis TaxID=2905665 RepID=A0ABR1WW32_9PEZI